MSAADVAIVAPPLSSLFVPSARGSSGWPGTANTSRPCSAAIRAVISDPDRVAASTITTPIDNARNDAVAAREIIAARAEARRLFADDAAFGADPGVQIPVLRWIDVIDAARHHRDGAALARAPLRAPRRRCPARDQRRRPIRRRRAPTANCRAISRPAADALRDPTIATIACASSSTPPFHINERRRHAGVHEGRRIARLDREQRPRPDRARRRKLGLRLAARMDLHRLPPPAATREVRQCGQRLLRAAA